MLQHLFSQGWTQIQIIETIDLPALFQSPQTVLQTDEEVEGFSLQTYPDSITHELLHPSPSDKLWSSQFSTEAFIPSPQTPCQEADPGLLNIPKSQFVQLVEPIEDAYVFEVHWVQLGAPEFENVPVGHRVHEEEPVLEYAPANHCAHVEAPALE